MNEDVEELRDEVRAAVKAVQYQKSLIVEITRLIEEIVARSNIHTKAIEEVLKALGQ